MKALKNTDVSYVFVDEVSMVPEIFYKFFITMKRLKPELKFIIAGDFEQLLPVNDRVEGCDYKNSHALYELCDGNRLQLSKCRRSDDRLFNMLLKDNIGNINKTDFPRDFTTRHICYTNITRKKVNTLMMNQHAKKAMKTNSVILELDGLEYSDNSQDVKLTAGTPLIARVNNKAMDIFNNEMWMITKINKKSETITIKEEDGDKTMDIPNNLVQKLFNPGWCITCHKSQGSTYDHLYTVHEFDKMDERLKYVALSRSTKIEYITLW
jgi:ATP-dependent exoDNAse (exonuclease V) alpha subunit